MQALKATLLPRAIDGPCITGVHLCVNDAALSDGQVGAHEGRFPPNLIWLWCSGARQPTARAADEALFAGDALVALGAEPTILRGLYHLE